ncbi:MAG: hypothetical protein PHW10_02355 [Candidatus Peribacteraceae bacterium]|nr:hypothetical protein [Candidatus Peribacteraceae bacterium]
MATHLASYGELTAMSLEDLRKEIREQRLSVERMHIGIRMNKEKDSAKYRREKRALARMLTAVAHIGKNGTNVRPEPVKGLKKKPKTRTVTAPAQS